MGEVPKRRVPPWVVWGLILGAFGAGYWIQGQFDFEPSLVGLRAWIESGGAWAPLLFVAVITFRQFLFLPSLVLLSVGGFGFGLLWGTILGGLGLFLSGMLTFSLGRGLGGEGLRQRVKARYPEMEARIEKLGPWLVFAVMVYPGGPMTAVFWASGVTTIGVVPYGLAVLVGGVIRAFIYSLFGATLIEGLSEYYLWIIAGMTAVFILPLCFPAVRELVGLGRSER